jgi:hypothetical protein
MTEKKEVLLIAVVNETEAFCIDQGQLCTGPLRVDGTLDLEEVKSCEVDWMSVDGQDKGWLECIDQLLRTPMPTGGRLVSATSKDRAKLNEAAFFIESVCHLQGQEQFLPLAEFLRALHSRLWNFRTNQLADPMAVSKLILEALK